MSQPLAEYDLLGRKALRRVGMADYLLLVARSDPGRVRRVPASAIHEEGSDDLGDFAFVWCPCGTRLIVRRELAKCDGCERYYTLVGVSVFVAYGAMTVPPLPKQVTEQHEPVGKAAAVPDGESARGDHQQ